VHRLRGPSINSFEELKWCGVSRDYKSFAIQLIKSLLLGTHSYTLILLLLGTSGTSGTSGLDLFEIHRAINERGDWPILQREPFDDIEALT
jgi:hypothetical protein